MVSINPQLVARPRSCLTIGTMMKLERLLAIVIKLLSHQRVSAQQLANEFGVSKRTIFRDLQSISLSNIPLISTPGKLGGWEIMPEYLLDRRVLSIDDLANLISALNSVDRGVSHPSVKRTLDKMKSLVPPSKKRDVQEKMQYVIIDSLSWGMRQAEQQKLDVLLTAIYDRVLISFTYHNLKKERSKRTIEPMTLLQKGASWYVFGYCLDKDDCRLFRLSRIQKLKRLNTPFTRREIDMNPYRTCPSSADKGSKPTTFTLRFHRDESAFIGDFFGLDNVTYQGKYGTLTVRLPENDWLYGALLSFGDAIQIQSPKRLADLIKQKAQNIIKLYT